MALSKTLRRQCFERDGYHCRVCNNTKGLHPHHIKYKNAGGEDTLENLLTVCWICHRAIHDGFLKCGVGWVDGKADWVFTRLRGWKP